LRTILPAGESFIGLDIPRATTAPTMLAATHAGVPAIEVRVCKAADVEETARDLKE